LVRGEEARVGVAVRGQQAGVVGLRGVQRLADLIAGRGKKPRVRVVVDLVRRLNLLRRRIEQGLVRRARVVDVAGVGVPQARIQRGVLAVGWFSSAIASSRALLMSSVLPVFSASTSAAFAAWVFSASATLALLAFLVGLF
jgi:hypothetical protein